MIWVNDVVQGILLGGLYALFACGLSFLYGVMRVINLAHGDLAILGAYVVVTLTISAGAPLWLAIIVMMLALAVAGVILQFVIFLPAMRIGEIPPLLATFGLSVVIQNLLLEKYSANLRSISAGSFGTDSWQVNSTISLPEIGVVTLLLAVVVLGGLQLFLKRTDTGRRVQATADDSDTAGLVGIDARRMYAIAAAISIAVAGLAGAFLATHTEFGPSSGSLQLIFAFEAVVIGGLGSMWGTLVGGILLGVAQTVGAQVNPSYSILAGHLLFVVVLIVLPNGVFAARQVRR